MQINQKGHLIDPRIVLAIRPTIEGSAMRVVRGIIVHQTDSPTASSTLNSYRASNANGAHFLIDRDGTIYQTASIFAATPHVGLMKARCLAEHRCSPADMEALKKFNSRREHRREQEKEVPDRYPSNKDAIGIEIVGMSYSVNATANPVDRIYEQVSDAQNRSLKWLVQILTLALRVPMSEVFRHPTVAYKNLTEAATATWR
ncbi:peptidoglycan recognition protein family protein [Eleftheria terrae]|uniref:peptidoglycan recognition protein family protein n=1 Tax=Eleftheria terrae TaxID=1597781 RepID=UPI00263B7F06|nr:N-acetylmuramoyl-L-alanine amidase [Eleftheria terrae]WKB51231.1 N-acetylmuramoyl-L-alanine amidase [Eleftheria terrae]